MAVYAAMSSLKQTIQRLLKSSNILFFPSQNILQIAYEEVTSLQVSLGRLGSSDTERVNALNAQIRDVVRKLEDAIVSHESNEFLSQTKNQMNIGAGEILSLDLREVKQEFCSLAEIAKMMQEDNKIEDLLAEEDDNIPLRTDFGAKCSKMVGFSDLFNNVKQRLRGRLLPRRHFVFLTGMAGIGKTTLAMKIFEDPEILSQFKHRAFVSVGPKFQLKKVMLGILAQLTPHVDEIRKKEVNDVGKCLNETLRNGRYLIVLDDLWDKSIYDLIEYLPKERRNDQVLLTTSIQTVAKHLYEYKTVFQMPFLNEEESWNLLRERVFGEENLCPFPLEKHGKKIAENCEGLPLAIITIADILSRNDKTPEYWKKTAKRKNSVFTDAYDQMFEALYPSYKYLIQSLKPCFLYMGVFPPGWKITTSKIVKLLSAEGFLEPPYLEKLEDFARACFGELISRSLAKVHQQSSKLETKIWSLHSAFWHMCNKLARTERFFHVINRYPNDISTKVIKSQQRFCIHNNVLFAIKEVYNSIGSISMVRSLLCTGIHHQYPVPICFGLRSLRVLDALTVRFYKFPIEVLKLVQLRYLALSCNKNIPTSISKLWNLEYFFVRRHMRIKPFGSWPFLPLEIWNMKKLRHLQVMGSNLPYHCGAMLPNLLTLSNVSADTCTKEILEGIPNLEKLGIQIELPLDAAEPLCLFNCLSHLQRLESLKCIIVNPKPRSYAVAYPTVFPSSLKKLNLRGLGYPWEYMSVIGQLPNLRVLKLKCYAFQGPVWEVYDGEFPKLTYLLIEETDLVHWIVNEDSCHRLSHLIFRHCYKLKKFTGDVKWWNKIEVVDCPLAVVSVKKMQGKDGRPPRVSIKCSWDDAERKS